MGKFSSYIAIAGTAVCALGISFFMQYGREVPHAQAPEKPPVDAAALAENTSVSEVPEDPAGPGPELVARSTLTLTNAALVTASLPEQDPDTPAQAATPDPSETADCAIYAWASERPAAMIRLELDAPCFPNERVTLHHSGMMFADITDANGRLSVDIPALREQATVIAGFSNGKGAVAQTQIAALRMFDRIALQWAGDQGFQIHAREYGAAYGEAGHVWSGSSRTGADADQGTGGFVTSLGNAETLSPLMVEVYSFPTQAAQRAGTVQFSIEAEVTSANCGRALSAQMLGLSPGQRLRSSDVSMTIPNCNAIGDFLVLNNLVDDLKIAGQ